MAKLKNSNCDKTKKKTDKTWKIKLWPNSKSQIVQNKKKSNCDNSKTQIVIVIKRTVVTEVVIMTSFSKNTLTPWQPTNFKGSFSQLLRCFLSTCDNPPPPNAYPHLRTLPPNPQNVDKKTFFLPFPYVHCFNITCLTLIAKSSPISIGWRYVSPQHYQTGPPPQKCTKVLE